MKDILNFFNAESMSRQELDDGIVRFIYTAEKLQVVEYHFPAGVKLAAHSHDSHEQMGYLVSGAMVFSIGGTESELGPGDWYHAPIGVEHSARNLDAPSVVLDIFSPPREDLM